MPRLYRQRLRKSWPARLRGHPTDKELGEMATDAILQACLQRAHQGVCTNTMHIGRTPHHFRFATQTITKPNSTTCPTGDRSYLLKSDITKKVVDKSQVCAAYPPVEQRFAWNQLFHFCSSSHTSSCGLPFTLASKLGAGASTVAATASFGAHRAERADSRLRKGIGHPGCSPNRRMRGDVGIDRAVCGAVWVA